MYISDVINTIEKWFKDTIAYITYKGNYISISVLYSSISDLIVYDINDI